MTHAATAETKMEYARLGKSGLKVSKICLGCMSFAKKPQPGFWSWVLDEKESISIIEAAWKAGVNFYDTANYYSNGDSEEVLGKAIKELGIPRDEIVIATKVYLPMSKKEPLNDDKKAVKNSIPVNNKGLSRKHIFSSCEDSLKRLGTDYIDLYQIHRFDDETPVEETMKALHDLVEAGKVRYLGASTMHAWQFALLQECARKNGWTEFVSMQNLYNLVYREEERDMNAYCYATGVGLIPWSPLAGGYLTRETDPTEEKDKSSRVKMNEKSTFSAGWFDDSTKAVRTAVHTLAKEKKVSAAEISLAWLLHQAPVSSPIIGVTKLAHLESALASVKVKLSDEELDTLEKHYTPRGLQGWITPPKVNIRKK